VSLRIDEDSVVAVLLADGWHQVKQGTSFALDAYEYESGGRQTLVGGSVTGVPGTGASWIEPGGTIISCPLTSVLAVRIRCDVQPAA
jgi:hypothetical protein